jgi:hypothetical protein
MAPWCAGDESGRRGDAVTMMPPVRTAVTVSLVTGSLLRLAKNQVTTTRELTVILFDGCRTKATHILLILCEQGNEIFTTREIISSQRKILDSCAQTNFVLSLFAALCLVEMGLFIDFDSFFVMSVCVMRISFFCSQKLEFASLILIFKFALLCLGHFHGFVRFIYLFPLSNRSNLMTSFRI